MKKALLNLKQFCMGVVRVYLWKWYEKAFEKLVMDMMEKQHEQLMEAINIASENKVPVIMTISPETAIGLAQFAAGSTSLGKEEKPKKDNPFSLVEDDDE